MDGLGPFGVVLGVEGGFAAQSCGDEGCRVSGAPVVEVPCGEFAGDAWGVEFAVDQGSQGPGQAA
ncbi:hypothetical protein [Embleya sp. NPDC020630]|uniref:hypothetical protein n=1 Tax=Embleya sp. NPDC020630 TaxID=3363979 RepID=UPI0037BA7A5E